MSDLLAARLQMALSLGFHIVFAIVGMAMPLLMAIAEWLHLRTKDPLYLELAKRWARGTAILFAVGAVSGTVLSFELGLLWPTFMEHAGPVVGMPFSLEGFAFFLEAIFLGVYLYGWDKLSPRLHLLSGVLVAVSGVLSGVFVVAVNAWMNTPSGVTFEDGRIAHIDLVRAFFSPAFPSQALHMVLAAYASVAIAVLGIHSWGLLRGESRFHLAAAKIAFAVLAATMPLQLLTGDLSAKHVAQHQPIKLAAMEGLFETKSPAPLAIGGFPDEAKGELAYAIEIPYGLSILAFADPKAEVRGLHAFPRDEWPPVAPTHTAFQVMVFAGTAMLGVVALGAWLWLRRGGFWKSRRFLRLAFFATPLGVIAVEAGWTVTEVGRQPWVIHSFLRTRDAVTPVTGLTLHLAAFTALYILLAGVVITLLRAHVFAAPVDADPNAKAAPGATHG
ncbi:MAG: cytochrome ubiquinol oxidase subunit I [Myxococcales bacterium]|nr:cytochrome ubiquinol oxidase subunit I [Myxococcales bacterium]